MLLGRKRIPLAQAGAELAQLCASGVASFRDQIADFDKLVTQEFLVVHVTGYRTGIRQFCYSKAQTISLLDSFDSNFQQITGDISELINTHGQPHPFPLP